MRNTCSIASCRLTSSRFSTGGYLSLFSVAAVEMGEIEDAGRRVGMYMSVIAFGAMAGPPISGAISTATGGYVDAGYYAGMFVKCDVFGWTLILSRWHQYVCRCIATFGAIPPPRMPMGQGLNENRMSMYWRHSRGIRYDMLCVGWSI